MSTKRSPRAAVPEKDIGTALFGKGRRNVLGALFANPDQPMYMREIVSAVGMSPGQVHRELENLHRVRLVLREERGHQVYYRPNPDAPIFEELRGIAFKTFGLAAVLRAALEPYRKQLACAFVFGSVAREADVATSDIDLLVISDKLGPSDLLEDLTVAESHLRRRISLQVFGKKEFSKRASEGDHFIGRLLDRPRLMIIGSEDDLARLAPRKPA